MRDQQLDTTSQSSHTTQSSPTDATVLDLTGTGPTDPTAALSAASVPPRGPERRRRRGLIAAAVALALGTGVAVVALTGGASTPASGGDRAPVGLVAAGAAQDGTSAPTADPASEPTSEPTPQPPAPPAEPGVLAVNTGVIWLFAGDYDASFTVRNDGGSPIDWTFQPGIGAIGVSQWGGTLAPGESTVVQFTINPFQLADGPFVFVNHVVGGGADRAITIHGVKKPIVVNPDIPKLDLPLQPKP